MTQQLNRLIGSVKEANTKVNMRYHNIKHAVKITELHKKKLKSCREPNTLHIIQRKQFKTLQTKMEIFVVTKHEIISRRVDKLEAVSPQRRRTKGLFHGFTSENTVRTFAPPHTAHMCPRRPLHQPNPATHVCASSNKS